jgi:uncharacterized membrane protein YdjX (TVP38/TMEM64 family)
VRYLLLVTGLMAAFLVAFAVVAAAGVPVLDDPRPWLAGGGAPAATLGVGLLVADVVLPVPSSLVMLANGALFGVVLGTVLSTVGGLGPTAAGYWLGRWGGSRLPDRVCPAAERERVAGFVRRWGVLAVIATRPVPILAETVAVVAGAERLGPWRTAAGALAGTLPAAALYAAAGAAGVAGPAGIVAFAAALVISVLLWSAGRWLRAGGRATGPSG